VSAVQQKKKEAKNKENVKERGRGKKESALRKREKRLSESVEKTGGGETDNETHAESLEGF